MAQQAMAGIYPWTLSMPPRYQSPTLQVCGRAVQLSKLAVWSCCKLRLRLDAGEQPEHDRWRAAAQLISNHAAVTKFAARGVGEPGNQPVWAALSDPGAKPGEAALPAVDAGALLQWYCCCCMQRFAKLDLIPLVGCRLAACSTCIAGGAGGQAGLAPQRAPRGPGASRESLWLSRCSTWPCGWACPETCLCQRLGSCAPT